MWFAITVLIVNDDVPEHFLLAGVDLLELCSISSIDVSTHKEISAGASLQQSLGHFIFPHSQKLNFFSIVLKLIIRWYSFRRFTIICLYKATSCYRPAEVTQRKLPMLNKKDGPALFISLIPTSVQFYQSQQGWFNYFVYFDVMYLNHDPLLQIIDEATNFHAYLRQSLRALELPRM